MKDINDILNHVNNILADTAKTRSGKKPERYKIKKIPVDNTQKLKQLLQAEYSTAYKKYLDGKAIFRGVYPNDAEWIGKYSVLKPGIRIAYFTKNNLYTRLFSGILPSWKNYPPRNNCFIGSSSTGKALVYARWAMRVEEWEDNLYVLLPKNGANICICPTSNILFAFPKILKMREKSVKFKHLNDFQDGFMDFIGFITLIIYELKIREAGKNISKDARDKYFGLLRIRRLLKESLDSGGTAGIISILNILSKYLSEYIDDLINIIEEADPVLKSRGFKAKDRYNALLFIKELKKYNTTNLLEYLDIILNAKENGFKNVTIEDYNIKALVTKKVGESGQEVWTDAECLYVNKPFLESLI